MCILKINKGINCMNKLNKRFLNWISSFHVDMKENYKLYRKVHSFLNPQIAPIYSKLDFSIYGDDGEIPIRLFVPKDYSSDNLIIFFHGGGWVTGNIDSYSNSCAALANRTGQRVLAVDYRLAPEHPFPKGLSDCYKVYEEVLANADSLQVEADNITLVGDSAGGNLAAAVSLLARDNGIMVPSKQILIYPLTYFDHSAKSPYASVVDNGTGYVMTSKRIQDYMDLYVPNEDDRISPYVAPALAKDKTNQPATLVVSAEYDPLRDEGEHYGELLKVAGNVANVYRMPNEIHGFWTGPLARKAKNKLYEYINNFLKEEI